MQELTVDGAAIAYRLYDVGYEIDLDRAARCLGVDVQGRARPGRSEARAFQIRHPPLSAFLGERSLSIDGRQVSGRLSAHLFDFGVCSLHFTLPAAERTPWSEYAALAVLLDAAAVAAMFEQELQGLLERLRPAIDRPGTAPVMEEYVVFRVRTLYAGAAPAVAADVLTDEHLAGLLLGERKPLSVAARRELLGKRFSYYPDDLVVLTWDNALIVEPQEADRDVEYVLEFATAQLLEVRVYDALLDGELPSLYDRISAARRRLLTGRFRAVLADVQTRVADVTEIVERADNAIKVIDDVHLARIYEGALELFRERSWRTGLDRKLQIFRETYAMLNDETQAARAELLEIAIVALIVLEIVLSFIR